MGELITSANIDLVIKKNNEIRNEVLEQTMKLQINYHIPEQKLAEINDAEGRTSLI